MLSNLNICFIVINKSLRQGIFPDELKIARVRLIYKEGPKTDVSNYRPISLLGSISKICEKLCTCD